MTREEKGVDRPGGRPESQSEGRGHSPLAVLQLASVGSDLTNISFCCSEYQGQAPELCGPSHVGPKFRHTKPGPAQHTDPSKSEEPGVEGLGKHFMVDDCAQMLCSAI